MEIVHVNLSVSERRRIDRLRSAVGEVDGAALWDLEDETNFQSRFNDYRRACFVPYNVENIDQFLAGHNRIEILYQSRRVRDLCAICLEFEGLDSITRCFHTFCISCFQNWYDVLWASHVAQRGVPPPHCPNCRAIVRRPDRELVSPSSKMKAIVSRAQTFVESDRPYSKLVILSSCLGTLLWLHKALHGLNILNACVVVAEDLTPPILNPFLQSVFLDVLLMPISAVQFRINLPPGSMVIVAEAVVADVGLHLMHLLTSFRIPNSVNYVSLVSRGTVEEVIAVVPLLPDAFNSYEGQVFVGPVFEDVDRLLEILHVADQLEHDPNDDAED